MGRSAQERQIMGRFAQECFNYGALRARMVGKITHCRRNGHPRREALLREAPHGGIFGKFGYLIFLTVQCLDSD